MTETYISENFDSRAELLSRGFTDESDIKSVENSKNLEDIQFCHLMTVDAATHSQQGLGFDDSLMTVMTVQCLMRRKLNLWNFCRLSF